MRNWALVVGMMLGLGCGGQVEGGPSGGSEGGPMQDGALTDDTGSGAGGSSPADSGAALADAQAGTSYVPETANVPAAGDGRLSGGSFEGNLGNGWDFCSTKSPGAARVNDGDRPSDGDSWLEFDSRKTCSDSFACQAKGDDAQVGFWLDTPLPPGAPVHLYFDAINLSGASLSGVLHVDVLQNGCKSADSLATIPLVDLGLTSDWATRCVSFTPNAAVDVFGLYVSGEAFQLGLDTFRFGPECRH